MCIYNGLRSKMEVGNNRSDSDASATVSASSAVAETNAPNTETPLITVGEPVMPEFSGLDDTALVSYRKILYILNLFLRLTVLIILLKM